MTGEVRRGEDRWKQAAGGCAERGGREREVKEIKRQETETFRFTWLMPFYCRLIRYNAIWTNIFGFWVGLYWTWKVGLFSLEFDACNTLQNWGIFLLCCRDGSNKSLYIYIYTTSFCSCFLLLYNVNNNILWHIKIMFVLVMFIRWLVKLESNSSLDCGKSVICCASHQPQPTPVKLEDINTVVGVDSRFRQTLRRTYGSSFAAVTINL